ncbi:MAG: uracil-DNA glycosylase [Ignavibacteria bacterium]|jgi:DNA polymerase|nr:uracil-DNA glycosylase [Ignavibacteria bacterium]
MLNKEQILNYFEAINSTGSTLLYFDNVPANAEPKPHISLAKPIPPQILAEKIIENKIINEEPEHIKTEFKSPNLPYKTLDELRNGIANCKQCILGATRNKLVFGEGNPNADLMVIGEAPGADEDEQGMPFVGRAGKLLTDILKAINFERSDIYIANICKCRPPSNRKPMANEITCCEPYLHKQIEIIQPKIMLALGLTAAEALFHQQFKMGDIRGKFLNFNGIQTMITYHPAALLRNPNWKRPVWEDVQELRKMYDELVK